MKRDYYMEGGTIALYYIAFLVSTYIMAIFVSLTFESPFMALEKLFLGPPPKKREKNLGEEKGHLEKPADSQFIQEKSGEFDSHQEKPNEFGYHDEKSSFPIDKSQELSTQVAPVSFINDGFITDNNGSLPNGNHIFASDTQNNLKGVEQF